MTTTELRIVGAEMSEAPAAARVAPRLPEHTVAVEVENRGSQPVYVWASRRAYEYDPSTRVLTLYLTDHKPGPPPDIVMISNHPRTPAQVAVAPGGRARIDVQVPAVIRRRVPATGLGMSFVEEPIGPVDRIDAHVQYASEPFENRVGERPEEHQQRLRAHGQVTRATITPTRSTER
jgi:hypothetical protein